jgi:hypothetical protein
MMLYINAEDLDSLRCGPEALRFLRRKAISSGMLAPGRTPILLGSVILVIARVERTAATPRGVAADPIVYCPTGLFNGMSFGKPHCLLRVLWLWLCMTHQNPVDGRHTATSALRSPS